MFLGQTASDRIMNTDPITKLAKQRLIVLELAIALENVSRACRRRGTSRITFYDYTKRFEKHSLILQRDFAPETRFLVFCRQDWIG